MLPFKTLLVVTAALPVWGMSASAQNLPPQKPEDPAAMTGCPGMMGMGMKGMGMKGMHRMMGSDGKEPGMQNAMPMGMGMMRPGMMMGGTPGMVDARLAELKAELAIADSQADAWNAYAAAVKNQANSMQRLHASMMQTMQTGTAVDRLGARISHMRVMLDALTGLKPATEGLYKVLTDEQRAKADLLIGTGCGLM